MKALDNPTVQRIVAVSDTNRLEKIREEIEGLPENFRKSLAFWEVDDVTKTHEKLSDNGKHQQIEPCKKSILGLQ